MSDQTASTNPLLISLVFSLSQAALMQMGKIANPMNGKAEKNLNQAKVSIDMLEMIKDKTIGNLSQEEVKLLNETVADLQLNYAHEINSNDDSETQSTIN
ncbi:DUF1844 domain-containing protein [bacterium]